MTHPSVSWCHAEGGDWLLMLYVQPGARRTVLAGLHDGIPRLRLAAPAVEGKANAALIVWLSNTFDLPRRAVVLEQGERARYKRIRLCAPPRAPQAVLDVLLREAAGGLPTYSG